MSSQEMGPPVGIAGANARMMAPGPEYELLRRWTGAWDVRMRLWASPDAEPTELAPMVARRILIRDAYLSETLEAAPGSDQAPFTRLAYLSFSNLRRRYEYVSMDSRAPGMMYETSFDDVLEAPDTVTLYLDAFPFAGWGDEVTGQFVKQRRTLAEVAPDTTVCRQYWQFPGTEPYLAVEYLYRRVADPS